MDDQQPAVTNLFADDGLLRCRIDGRAFVADFSGWYYLHDCIGGISALEQTKIIDGGFEFPNGRYLSFRHYKRFAEEYGSDVLRGGVPGLYEALGFHVNRS